jgi:hypothetical protein
MQFILSIIRISIDVLSHLVTEHAIRDGAERQTMGKRVKIAGIG